MNIKTVENFVLKDVILISSLPDMGKVGGLVTEHLQNALDTKISSKVVLYDKPWVNQKDGMISVPSDEYTIHVDKKNAIVIFTGNNQPQEPNVVISMTEKILETVKKIGNIKLVISAGGYLPAEKNGGKSVYGVATDEKSMQILKDNNIPVLGNEVSSITWFNGLVLGKAKQNAINGIGLFGEIHEPDSPQYLAASNIIKLISKILKINIDTTEIDKKIIPIQTEVKKDRPGIG